MAATDAQPAQWHDGTGGRRRARLCRASL